MVRLSGKIDNFFEHEIVFLCNINLFFVDIKYFFVQPRLFYRHGSLVCATSACYFWQQIIFCATSKCFAFDNFFFAQHKFLFWMVIYFYCHIIIKISSSPKKIKFYFHVKQKKLTWSCVHHKFFTFNFYVAYWQHVDLPRNHPSNKQHLFHLSVFTQLLDLWKQWLRADLEKRCSWNLGSIFVKHLRRTRILLKLQTSFPQHF